MSGIWALQAAAEAAEPWWRVERRRRRRERAQFRAEGRAYPRLRTICCVDLDVLQVPDWAAAKALPGFEMSGSRVWLGRILAQYLARMDREAGGRPLVTAVAYRRCPACGRALLGEEARARWELDKRLTGRMAPCGPECVERQKAAKRKGRHGRETGVAVGGVVRHREKDERAA